MPLKPRQVKWARPNSFWPSPRPAGTISARMKIISAHDATVRLVFLRYGICALLAVLLPAATPAQDAIPSSTGFESVAGRVYAPGATLEGWRVVSNQVEIIADAEGAHGGANYLALAAGHISKTFATQPGATYQLRYYARGFGIIDWWPADNNAEDVVGANNGTVRDARNVTYTDGEASQAFSFTGGRVNRGNEANEVDFGVPPGNFGTSNFSIDFWIKMPPSATGQYAVLEKRRTCDSWNSYFDIHCGHVWSFSETTNGRLFMDMAGDGLTAFNIVIGKTPINDNTFHHAAFVRNGPNLSVYIDGRLDASSNASGGIASIINNDHFRAGRSICEGIDTSVSFTGELDEIDMFNRALSSAEIHAIYAAGGSGKYGPVSTFMPNFQLSISGALTNNVILDSGGGPWQLFTNTFVAKKSNVTVELEGCPLGVLLDDIEMAPGASP
jgi:hypothetical protein